MQILASKKDCPMEAVPAKCHDGFRPMSGRTVSHMPNASFTRMFSGGKSPPNRAKTGMKSPQLKRGRSFSSYSTGQTWQ